jgi:hypothetical protein
MSRTLELENVNRKRPALITPAHLEPHRGFSLKGWSAQGKISRTTLVEQHSGRAPLLEQFDQAFLLQLQQLPHHALDFSTDKKARTDNGRTEDST